MNFKAPSFVKYRSLFNSTKLGLDLYLRILKASLSVYENNIGETILYFFPKLGDILLRIIKLKKLFFVLYFICFKALYYII